MSSQPPPWFYLLVLNKAAGQQTRDPGVCFNSEDHRFGFQFSCLLWGRAQLSVVPGCSCTLGRRRGKRSICTQLCPARHPPAPSSCQQPWQFLLQNGSAFPLPSPPLPTWHSLLPSAFSTPLPGIPKEPKRSFSRATNMHSAPTMCLALFSATRLQQGRLRVSGKETDKKQNDASS